MASIQDESRLLGLPMELLQRVTGFVGEETLIQLRLTCKTLDTATFDQFAHCYCENRRCFTRSDDRWEHLRSVVKRFPRLSRRLKSVLFTTDVFERDREEMNNYDLLQLAPQKQFSNNIRDAQKGACKAECRASSFRGDLNTMIGVMRQLQLASPAITTRINLAPRALDLRIEDDNRDLVIAVVSAPLSIERLFLSYTCIAKLHGSQTDPKLRSSLLESLLMCTRPLREFGLWPDIKSWYANELPTEKEAEVVRDIVGSAKELQILDMNSRNLKNQRQFDPFAGKVLTNSSTSNLTSLRLKAVTISQSELQTGLLLCRMTLQDFHVARTRLNDYTDGWSGVLHTVANLAKLYRLYLRGLRTGSDNRHRRTVDLEHFKSSKELPFEYQSFSCGYFVELLGEDAVEAGLRELLSKPLTYI